MTPTPPVDLKKEIVAFAGSDEHTRSCIGFWESQLCCLEEPEVLDFLDSLLTRRVEEVLDDLSSKLHEQKAYPNTEYGDTGLPNVHVVYGYNEAINEVKAKIQRLKGGK